MFIINILSTNQNMNKLLIVIQGPTASGKTALAIELAKTFNTVVFSADSRQFYKELSIGTAKPSAFEQQGVKHYFVDSHSIHDKITAATFVSEIKPKLADEFLKNNIIILVGGSGMYIDALCYGLDEMPINVLVKNELIDEYRNKGIECLLAELKMKDPQYFSKVDRQNPVRIIRALEVIRTSGRTLSSFLKDSKTVHSFDIKKYTIDLDREILYDRINKRVDLMVLNGLEQEARSVFDYRGLQALQTVGYSEWFDFFDGKFDENETIERIKQNTRRYAKRQLTWFRRDKSAIWLKGKNIESQMEEINENLNSWRNEN
jgi:tRNA dimethylallyltransferase